MNLSDERGSVESALVLIPLLILFLIGFQISYTVHARNMESITAQDQASTRAISGKFNSKDEFIHIESSGDGQNLDLLVTRRSNLLIDFIPRVFRSSDKPRALNVSGLAIVENQR